MLNWLTISAQTINKVQEGLRNRQTLTLALGQEGLETCFRSQGRDRPTLKQQVRTVIRTPVWTYRTEKLSEMSCSWLLVA